MWVAIWIVCVVGMECQQVVESDARVHRTEAACRAHAEHGTVEIIKMLFEERKRAQVGYQCLKTDGA